MTIYACLNGHSETRDQAMAGGKILCLIFTMSIFLDQVNGLQDHPVGGQLTMTLPIALRWVTENGLQSASCLGLILQPYSIPEGKWWI